MKAVRKYHMVTCMSRGLSSVVGLVLLLLALIIISSTIYSTLRVIDEYNSMSLNILNKQAVINLITYMTECRYRYVNNAMVVTVVSNLPEPFQVVGYVIFYGNLSYEVIKLTELEVIPPFSKTSLNLSLSREPVGVFIVVLIRDEITHVVVRKDQTS